MSESAAAALPVAGERASAPGAVRKNPDAPAAKPARWLPGGAAFLTVGTVGSGLLAYAFNALAARALGPEAYGPVAVLWAAMFLVAVVLFRPLEQTLARTIAERTAQGVDARPVVRSVTRLVGLASGVVALACFVLWSPITNGMFNGQDVLTVALVVGIACYGVSYLVRGVVGGLRWFGGYGALLLADGVVRLLVAVPLLVLASPAVAAAAIVAAAIAGPVAPLLSRGWTARRRLAGARQLPFGARDGLSFALPAAVVAAADQVLVSGGPLLVILAGGPGAAAAAGVVFAATMLVRAPMFLFQGVAAALLPSLTTLQARRQERQFRRSVAVTAVVLAGFAALMCVGALLAGPEAMRVLYGPGFEADRIALAVLSAGVGCYLAAATFSQAALARGQTARAATIWASSALLFVLLELSLAGDPFQRVSVAFAAAAALNATLFGVLVMRPARAAPDSP